MNIVRVLRQQFNLDRIEEIIPKINQLVLESESVKKIKKDLENIRNEFHKKKIGKMRIILDREKVTSKKQGVLYFDKAYIGERVIVWRK
ncbi:hypothetical protein DRJ17_06580 [Candidatus Woesearchaeota archaeon]|nr:MAG: hypothetical protein DRJ17_06580 [Candidatus Woesearchaeota archaeon]